MRGTLAPVAALSCVALGEAGHSRHETLVGCRLVHASMHGWQDKAIGQIRWRELWLEAPR